MFGVGSGGAQLTQAGIASAMSKAPRQGARGKPRARAPAADETDDVVQESPAIDGRDAVGPTAKDAGVEAALNALFAEPDWDDDDLPPPV
eukprot:5734115-Prymnesium_polylepis.1